MTTATDGFEHLGFAPGYEVEVSPEFPGDGDWGCPVFGFDRDGELDEPFESRWGPPVIVRVDAGEPWVASFAAGGIGGITGVYACPSPTDLCVVSDGSAYIVDVRHPEHGAATPLAQVSQVMPIRGRPLLLLARMTDLVAVGAAGIEWRSRRLCLDGLAVVSATHEAIRCTGEFLGEMRDPAVDPATGERAEGPPLPVGWPDE